MARADIAGELARFAMVGVLGFVVDSGVLYAGLCAGLGLYAGRLGSYLAAASFTWLLNRRFTFRREDPPSVREWLRFLAANGVGGSANLAIYAALVGGMAAQPVLGVAVGSLAGLFINFALSRAVVFRKPDPK